MSPDDPIPASDLPHGLTLDDPQRDFIHAWTAGHDLAPEERDCVTALMLKILDGKCRMGEREKASAAVLYGALLEKLGPWRGARLGAELHTLVADARRGLDEALVERIYEQRLYAETMISRPVMKAFKARLRVEGVFSATSED